MEFQGAKATNGYGVLYCPIRKKQVRAHRKAWEDANGKSIPEGMVIMHVCDNRKCINPEHLRLGTQGDNLRDMWAKGRQGERNLPTGEVHHLTTLTHEQVEQIRETAKPGLFRELARKYNVSRVTIRNIAVGKTWQTKEHTC